ncbi:WecB/TagA/CpsF family glycosyltransferase [bacterium]|nr:WecB/TagA/CpsF family glycosyltransferase [bacterium]
MLNKKRIKFFGAYIDPLTMDETLSQIENIIETRKITQHVVINVAKLVLLQKDEQLKSIVNGCGLINADGQGIVWGSRLVGIPIPQRVAGIDLFLNLVKLSAQKGYKFYLLGAKQDVVADVVKRFGDLYPSLKITGYRNGYFNEDEQKSIVADIREKSPDILFVAMTSPEKEIFLKNNIDNMQVPFSMGVGGSFDIVAGLTKRAPLWMQKIGMEWFFRFFCEPGRMWKRYLSTNSRYAFMLLKALIIGKKRVAGDF